MARRRGEVGKRRREQVVEAAIAIIAEEGLQRLSLSAIESRAGMSRGQLTYYFPAKEDILLAVFDHMIQAMHEHSENNEGPPGCSLKGLDGWERLKTFLTFFVLHPPDAPEFNALQYTFLSQVGHRDDFRSRLAQLYEIWRGHMANDLVGELPKSAGKPPVSPRTLATFVQAVLHGLAIQRVADPSSYDRQEMLTLCMHLLSEYLDKPTAPTPTTRPRRNGTAPRREK